MKPYLNLTILLTLATLGLLMSGCQKANDGTSITQAEKAKFGYPGMPQPAGYAAAMQKMQQQTANKQIKQ